jgi:predicted acetyltransferase
MHVNTWKVKKYNKSDIDPAGSFLKQQFKGIETYEGERLLKWKIVNNPAGKGIFNIIKDKGTIVSTTSVTPKKLSFLNKTYTVAEIGDTYTDPHYMRRGMFAQLINKSTKDALEKKIPFIYGTPNNQSLPGYEKKANYRIISNLTVQSLFLPIDTRYLLKNKIPYIGGFAGSVISYFTKLRFCIYSTFLNYSNAKNDFCISNEIIDDYNDFWDESKQAYDFILIRDKKYLQWRFNAGPNDYTILFLRRNEKIIGYIVYRIKSNDRYKNLAIADYLFLPNHEKHLSLLLYEILKIAKKEKIDTLSAWCVKNNNYNKAFIKSGFIKRDAVPVISFQNNFALDINAKTRNWHFTMSDSDNV